MRDLPLQLQQGFPTGEMGFQDQFAGSNPAQLIFQISIISRQLAPAAPSESCDAG